MRHSAMRARVCALLGGLSAAGLSASPLLAQGGVSAVEEFYRGKTVSMIVGYAPAGTNDHYARSVARHIGKHIPGTPTVVPRNMPGGGSLVAANHIYNVAPKDGTTLGLVVATVALEERLGAPNIRYKAARFNWIGRLAPTPNVTFVKATSPVKTIKDAFVHEATLGGTGRNSTAVTYPSLLNNLLGTKFKIILGYKGSAEALLAMESGEVDGHSTTWDGVKSRLSRQLADKSITLLVQYGLVRHPEMPDVPTAIELAKTPEQTEMLRLFSNASDIGRFILSTPDTPAERIEALRRAFDAMLKDPEFIADLKTQKLELNPLKGEELQKLVEDVASVPDDLVARAKKVYAGE